MGSPIELKDFEDDELIDELEKRGVDIDSSLSDFETIDIIEELSERGIEVNNPEDETIRDEQYTEVLCQLREKFTVTELEQILKTRQ